MRVEAALVYQLDRQRTLLVRNEGIEAERGARRPHDGQGNRRCARGAAHVDDARRVFHRGCIRDHELGRAQHGVEPCQVIRVRLRRPPRTPICDRAGGEHRTAGLRGGSRGNGTEVDQLRVPIGPDDGGLHVGIVDLRAIGDGQRVRDVPVETDGRRRCDRDQQAFARRDLDRKGIDTGQVAIVDCELEDVGSQRIERHVRGRSRRIRE